MPNYTFWVRWTKNPTYEDKYRTAAFAANVTAYRFVNTATGQETGIVSIGYVNLS